MRESTEQRRWRGRPEDNPWHAGSAYGNPTYWCDAQSRLARVRQMDADQLRRVIAWPDTQKTVRVAAERRLRRLERTTAA